MAIPMTTSYTGRSDASPHCVHRQILLCRRRHQQDARLTFRWLSPCGGASSLPMFSRRSRTVSDGDCIRDFCRLKKFILADLTCAGWVWSERSELGESCPEGMV